MTEKYLFGSLRIKKRLVAIISMLIALTLMTTISYNTYFTVYAENETPKLEEGAVAGKSNTKPKMPDVSSSSYIVISGSTSEVVLNKHSDRKMAPGKVTTLVTAMVVIDNMYNDRELDNRVTISKKLVKYGDTFQIGEKISVRDLLNAMLIGGNGQAAECLASYSASKRSIFIKEMNSKAMELELLDTHFTNPSGSYNAKQYASAADCAKIVQAAQRYSLIKDALGQKSTSISIDSGKETKEKSFRSTNPLLISDNPSDCYENIDGGILGTLNEPRLASQYAGIATIDDMQLIVILMDSTKSSIPEEAKGLLEYANIKVTRNTIIKKGKRVGTVKIRGGSKTRIGAYTATKGFAYVPPEGSDELITTEVVLYKDLKAPMNKGDKVGEYRIKVADELKGTVDLVLKENVETGWILSNIYISNNQTIGMGVVLFLFFVLWLRILAVKRRRRRQRKARRKRRLRELARQQVEMDEDRQARNWTYAQDYEPLPPRTTDIRKEAIYEAMDSEKGSISKH